MWVVSDPNLQKKNCLGHAFLLYFLCYVPEVTAQNQGGYRMLDLLLSCSGGPRGWGRTIEFIFSLSLGPETNLKFPIFIIGMRGAIQSRSVVYISRRIIWGH